MPRVASPPPSGPANANRGPGERGEQAAPAGGPERGRLLGGQPEVARPGRGREAGQRGADRAQVGVEGGAVGAGGEQGAGGLELGPGRVARGMGGDGERVVVGVAAVGDVRHQSPSPRNRPRWPSSRSRSASRPRWIRDFTVPSETPVSSAISA